MDAEMTYTQSMSLLLHSMRTEIQGGLLTPLGDLERQYPEDLNIKNSLRTARNLFSQAELINLIEGIQLGYNIEQRALRTNFFSKEKTEDGFFETVKDVISNHNSNPNYSTVSFKGESSIFNLNDFVKNGIFVTKLFNQVFVETLVHSIYGSTFTKKNGVEIDLIVKERGFFLSAKKKIEPSKQPFELIDSILRSLKIGKVEIISTNESNLVGFQF